MKKIVCVSLFLFILAGCKLPFKNPFSSGGDDDSKSSVYPERVIEPTSKFSLAIGGVAPGRDELVIYDADKNIRNFDGRTLKCEADDPIVSIHARPGYDSEASGSGVLLEAIDVGVTAVRCIVDGVALDDVYEVTVPPQHLIQILVAEAGEQLTDEAQVDEKGVVRLDSVSPTGSAIGFVIKNRINNISVVDDPTLFGADAANFNANPPESFYDAIIMAKDEFSPTNIDDPNHETFDDAQDRNFLSAAWQMAYDQAVITAAGIFNGDISDPTTGAFGFFSPTEDEWKFINGAWSMNYITIPDEAGFTDATFPRMTPIQLLIHPDVWKYSNGRPAFVFARKRTSADLAVVNKP